MSEPNVAADQLRLFLERIERLEDEKKGISDDIKDVYLEAKAIAKQYDVGVLALAQLNRSVESRPDKRPMLSDLRDSGQIEQDADAVVFLYRDEYYLRQGKPPETDAKFVDWQMALDKCAGHIDFIVAKRRNGPSGSATGRFFGAYQAVRGAVQ